MTTTTVPTTTASTAGRMPRPSRMTVRRGVRASLASLCAVLLVGCSGGDGNGGGGGGFLGFGGGNGADLVATDIGQGYVDGPTTTIVAPPGWDGDAGEGNADEGKAGARDDGDDNGFFGFGRKKKPDLSHLTPESVPDLCVEPRCSVDWRDIDHPSWGPTRVFLPSYNDYDPENFGAVGMAAVDASGEVKWNYLLLTGGGAPSFASDGPDGGETLYVYDNLGGIIVLRPSDDGFGALADGGLMGHGLDDENAYFSYATIGELDEAGNYEIEVRPTDGGRDRTMTWDGSKYVEK